MYKLGINFDEISDDLDTALAVMKEMDVTYGELRTLGGKNFVFWNDKEVGDFKDKVDTAGIELVAASTPLFKWYANPDDPDIPHDSFGFNPRLDNETKKATISRTIDIASTLGIPRLRIFSGLGKDERAGSAFARDPLLDYALQLAARHGIDLYLENEPVCQVYKKASLADFFAHRTDPNMKLWLDIANLIEVGETLDQAFLSQVAPRIGYLHVKDFVIEHKERKYVPVGEGVINYAAMLRQIAAACPQDLVITIETHAKMEKIEQSKKSVAATRKILNDLGGIHV